MSGVEWIPTLIAAIAAGVSVLGAWQSTRATRKRATATSPEGPHSVAGWIDTGAAPTTARMRKLQRDKRF